MDSVLMLVAMVAILSFTALCIYLIMLTVRVRDFLVTVEKDMKELTARSLPVLENLEVVTSRVKSITESLDDQMAAVRDSVTAVKTIADSIVEFERRVQERVEGPILETLGYAAAIVKGLRTFVQRLRS